MENEEHMENNKESIEQASSEHLTSETAQELDEGKETENLKKLEAALFLSARFLSLNDLVMLTDINPLMLRELVEKLIEKYNSDQSAIEIVSKEDLWKMDVKQEYVSMINKLATGSAEFTKAEQETLAVIAYKQPALQAEIIKMRGNKAYDHIKQLREQEFITSEKTGRTRLLKLAPKFFDYFDVIENEMKEKFSEIGEKYKVEEQEKEE